jgi:Matrixin
VALLRASDRNRHRTLGVLLRGIAGAAFATALLAVAAPRPADAYVVKKTSRGELVHWDSRTVDYTLDPSIAAVPDGVDATGRAMLSWSGTVGAPDLQAHAAANVQEPPAAPGYDQKNGVFFMPNGYAPAGKALAITVLTYDNASGRILDADIIVNGSYRFAVLETSTAAGRAVPVAGTHPSATDGIAHQDDATSPDAIYDLHHVVAHELGHSLGMNDELERKDALMYRYSAPNDATLRAPASDDIAGLAELYSTKLEATGNGCGNATVAPKKPSLAASHAAMAATFGFLLFLVLRGRSDRRARAAFVVAAAVATYALLPSVAARPAIARAGELAPGQARAKVLATSTTMEAGLLKTSYQLATTVCRTATCPKLGAGTAWGGTAGDIRQEVGGQLAPRTGDDVDVTFAALPSALAPLSRPLGGASPAAAAAVRVVTLAD